MEIRRGDIVIADLGRNKGSVQSGIRPVIIIQNDMGNKFSTTTIVVPITSSVKNQLPTHHEICKQQYKCLRTDSIILAEQLKTISKEQIVRVIGKLNYDDYERLNEILSVSINIKVS